MCPAVTDRQETGSKSSSLDVFLLGTVDLNSSLELQDRLRREVASRSDCHGTVIVCEHPPSITIGREGSFADVLVDREELIAQQLEIRWINRGGGAFIHLPGQISAYVVVPVERLGMGLLSFRRGLEQSLVSTAADLKIDAQIAPTVRGAVCRCGQFGFVGASIRDGISAGGVHLNVSLPQELLELVRWGSKEIKATSLSAQRGRAVAISSVRESLVRNLASALSYDSYHLFTGHTLLHRSSRKVYVFT